MYIYIGVYLFIYLAIYISIYLYIACGASNCNPRAILWYPISDFFFQTV